MIGVEKWRSYPDCSSRGEDKETPKAANLRFCILLPDNSGGRADEKGWLVWSDVEALALACETFGGIPSTVEAAEQIIKQNTEIEDLRNQLAATQIQFTQAVEYSNLTAHRQTLVVKERDDATKRIQQLEDTMRTAIAQLHHSYNDAPDWLEHGAHGWLRAAAIGLQDALGK